MGYSNPHQCSRGVAACYLPSIHADARCNDAVIVSRRPDGNGAFYYSPLLGELRLGDDIPPTVRGGLICDEVSATVRCNCMVRCRQRVLTLS